jgi:hypothetical protein
MFYLNPYSHRLNIKREGILSFYCLFLMYWGMPFPFRCSPHDLLLPGGTPNFGCYESYSCAGCLMENHFIYGLVVNTGNFSMMVISNTGDSPSYQEIVETAFDHHIHLWAGT